ncbi:MAG: YfhO family protein [Bryobacteraceae bacterium]
MALAPTENAASIASPPAEVTFRKKHLLPLILLVILICLFHWPVLSGTFTFVDNSPDITNMEVPDMELRAKALRQGIFPIWDPYAEGGRPMLAQMNPHLLDPFSTLFLLLPLKHGHLNFKFLDPYFVILRCCAGITAYLLLAELGLFPIACVFGGFLYATSGVTGMTVWPETIIETIYPPLVFVFLHRSLTGGRSLLNAGIAGAIGGLAWLSGTHHIPLITSLLSIVMLAAALFLERRWRGGLLRITIFCGMLGCISAPQILPSLEMAPYVFRWVGLAQPIRGSARVPIASHWAAAVQPEHLLGIALPGNLNLNDNGMEFLGVVALTFIALAFMHWSSSRLIRFLGFVSLAGALLPIAEYNHIYGLLYTIVPLIEKLREPAYWFFLLQIGGCCLAAIGLDRFLRQRSYYQSVQPLLIRVLLLLGAVIFVGSAMWGMNAEPSKQVIVNRYALSGLIALLLGTLFLADRKRPLGSVAFGGMLLALVFIGHGDVSGHTSQANFVFAHPPAVSHIVQPLYDRRELGEFLKTRPDVERIDSSADVPEALGDAFLLEDMSGFEGTVLAEYFQLGPWNYRTQQLYGVRYYIAKKPLDPRQTLLYSSAKTGVNIYRNPDPQPRTWAVHRLIAVTQDKDFEAALLDPKFDMSQTAALKGPVPQLETCGSNDKVRMVSRMWFQSTIDATLNCRGMVILNDNAYPGWYAFVDGHSSPVYRAYGALRGVVVNAGQHRIDFHFHPWSFFVGMILFAFGIGALTLISRLQRLEFRSYLLGGN